MSVTTSASAAAGYEGTAWDLLAFQLSEYAMILNKTWPAHNSSLAIWLENVPNMNWASSFLCWFDEVEAHFQQLIHIRIHRVHVSRYRVQQRPCISAKALHSLWQRQRWQRWQTWKCPAIKMEENNLIRKNKSQKNQEELCCNLVYQVLAWGRKTSISWQGLIESSSQNLKFVETKKWARQYIQCLGTGFPSIFFVSWNLKVCNDDLRYEKMSCSRLDKSSLLNQ